MRRLGCLILVGAAVIAVLLGAGNFLYGWNASGPLEETADVRRQIGLHPGDGAKVWKRKG